MSGPCSRITLFSDLGIRGPLNVEGPWLYPSQHQWRNEGGQGGTFAPGRSTLGAPNWSRNVTYWLWNVKCQRMTKRRMSLWDLIKIIKVRKASNYEP